MTNYGYAKYTNKDEEFNLVVEIIDSNQSTKGYEVVLYIYIYYDLQENAFK